MPPSSFPLQEDNRLHTASRGGLYHCGSCTFCIIAGRQCTFVATCWMGRGRGVNGDTATQDTATLVEIQQELASLSQRLPLPEGTGQEQARKVTTTSWCHVPSSSRGRCLYPWYERDAQHRPVDHQHCPALKHRTRRHGPKFNGVTDSDPKNKQSFHSAPSICLARAPCHRPEGPSDLPPRLSARAVGESPSLTYPWIQGARRARFDKGEAGLPRGQRNGPN